MVEPLLLKGISKETVAESEVDPAVITAETFRGADGTATAVTTLEANDADDCPTLFMALTVKV